VENILQHAIGPCKQNHNTYCKFICIYDSNGALKIILMIKKLV